jgi:ABC-type branched-subunit amino acid transport system ATPase component
VATAPLVVEKFGRRRRRTGPWSLARDLTLVHEEGSITAPARPTGAGKSTFVRTCVGFERPDEGRIVVGVTTSLGSNPSRRGGRCSGTVGYVRPRTPPRGRGVGDSNW